MVVNAGQNKLMEVNQEELSESSSELTADQPISSATHDALGRVPFAKQLAAAIASWKEDESVVIALYGRWGIGKTSVKKPCFGRAAGKGAEPPDVVQFNPWHWTGHDGNFPTSLRIASHSTSARHPASVRPCSQ